MRRLKEREGDLFDAFCGRRGAPWPGDGWRGMCTVPLVLYVVAISNIQCIKRGLCMKLCIKLCTGDPTH